MISHRAKKNLFDFHRLEVSNVTDSVSSNKLGILDECSRKALLVDHLPFYCHVQLNIPCNQKCIMCVPMASTLEASYGRGHNADA